MIAIKTTFVPVHGDGPIPGWLTVEGHGIFPAFDEHSFASVLAIARTVEEPVVGSDLIGPTIDGKDIETVDVNTEDGPLRLFLVRLTNGAMAKHLGIRLLTAPAVQGVA